MMTDSNGNVIVRLSDHDRDLLMRLVKAAEARTGKPGVVHQGISEPPTDRGDQYFGVGGYGSQDR